MKSGGGGKRQGYFNGRIGGILQKAVSVFPKSLKKYGEIILSPKVDAYYQLFRGVAYKNVPEKQYELVFVDGPKTSSPSDGQKTFDSDFLNVVARQEKAVWGIVDLRLSGMWVYEQVFGREHVRLDYGRSLGFIGPVTKKDMHVTNEIISKHVFRSSLMRRWKRKVW